MPPPDKTPIGLQLASTSKAVSRAFNEVLADAGGSLPIWLVLSTAKSEHRSQVDVARAVGIEGPTLTRHLDGMEEAGLVVRVRGHDDRRAVRVELTDAGEELFQHLRQAVVAFAKQLTSGISDAEIDRVRRTLAQLEANVAHVP
jgi:MarR family transcriptional regulator, transcriptional regulator for hemolysin